MVFNGPLSVSSTESDTESVGKVEKRGWESDKNSDQLRRKAMRGVWTSLAKYYRKLLTASSSGAKVIMPNLKKYTLVELKSATNSFSSSTMLGEGQFGRVFMGWVDKNTLVPSHVGNCIPVAIKKYNPNSHQGLCKWQSEVKFLGKFSHPNLVRLLGYCWEDNHYLLVYEYIQRKSLENHLFRRGAEPLPWDVRFKIAIGAARGLDFLHTSENNGIYGLFQSSHILLDADYNAKLSDFGLAKLGAARDDSQVTKLEEDEVIERHERYVYATPEYIATGHLDVKSDVYGFGVILLEMLTGLRALDNNHHSSQQNLVEWARPFHHDKRKLRTIMDCRLEGRYPLKAATQTAELTLKCLEGDPEARPSMDESLVTYLSRIAVQEKGFRAAPFVDEDGETDSHRCLNSWCLKEISTGKVRNVMSDLKESLCTGSPGMDSTLWNPLPIKVGKFLHKIDFCRSFPRMVFNWHSPSSTDSDTESVAKTGSCPFFPGTVLSAPFSQARTDSNTRSGGMGEKAEKRKWKLGLNSDRLGRKAMTGPPASRKALAKNPKVKRDALVGSEIGMSAVASGGGMDEALAAAKAGEVITPCLKMYTLAQLKSATRNFRGDMKLGEGGFGEVFKGWVDERTLAPSKVGSGIPVAVKKSNPDSFQGMNEWESEVKLLGKFSHPNIVKLLGYCWEDNQYLLVYEYLQRGSLDDHFFRREAERLPWDVRLKIAIGAARGLNFLHAPENNVIYRDFKPSNILLDAILSFFSSGNVGSVTTTLFRRLRDYLAGVLRNDRSDLGLAKLGPADRNSHVTTRVMGTYGYAAPEYIATVVDCSRPSGQQNLVERARPLLHDKRKLRKIMDPRLKGQYPLKAATQAAKLILKCLEADPKVRPSMEEVLATLENINTIWEKNQETREDASSRPSSYQHHHNHH
ncbi:hypothetical protein ACJRO7_025404 [Eucalyptus globulus]|uniref:non-specific serine/threonine protein kinase n=1 Tax=Eucalyptus globulus TaxID=34317 RepID=A0ABD3K941_EUCGL